MSTAGEDGRVAAFGVTTGVVPDRGLLVADVCPQADPESTVIVSITTASHHREPITLMSPV